MSDMVENHAAIWRSLDAIAEMQGLSPSALAIRAGRDPTAFNRSKRISKRGELRWPTMGTVAAALMTAGISYTEFGTMIDAALSEEAR